MNENDQHGLDPTTWVGPGAATSWLDRDDVALGQREPHEARVAFSGSCGGGGGGCGSCSGSCSGGGH